MKNIKTNNITPTKGRLLVEVYEGENETSSGLEIVTAGANTAPVLGTLLKVGKDSTFTEGDIVFFRRYSTDELRINKGETEEVFYFIDESDVLGVLVEKNLSEPKQRSGDYSKIEEKKDSNQKQDADKKATSGSQEDQANGKVKGKASKKG